MDNHSDNNSNKSPSSNVHPPVFSGPPQITEAPYGWKVKKLILAQLVASIPAIVIMFLFIVMAFSGSGAPSDSAGLEKILEGESDASNEFLGLIVLGILLGMMAYMITLVLAVKKMYQTTFGHSLLVTLGLLVVGAVVGISLFFLPAGSGLSILQMVASAMVMAKLTEPRNFKELPAS